MRELKKRVRDAQFMDSLAQYGIRKCSITAYEADCRTQCDSVVGGGTTYYTYEVFRDMYSRSYVSTDV